MYIYRVIRQELAAPGLGRYITYGIAALLVLAGQRQQVGFVADISPDRAAVQQLAAAYAARDRMGMLRVLLPMEKYKREQLLPLLQQLRACFCSALAQRGGFDAADQSAAQLVASRSGTELVQAADSLQTAIDDLAANASAGAVIGYLAMKLR